MPEYGKFHPKFFLTKDRKKWEISFLLKCLFEQNQVAFKVITTTISSKSELSAFSQKSRRRSLSSNVDRNFRLTTRFNKVFLIQFPASFFGAERKVNSHPKKIFSFSRTSYNSSYNLHASKRCRAATTTNRRLENKIFCFTITHD